MPPDATPRTSSRFAARSLVPAALAAAWALLALFPPAASAQLVGGPVRGTLDVEGLWFDVPFERVRTTYEDGEIVRVERLPGETSESPIRVRVGFVYYP